MAPHSSTLAWKILWTEEPGRLQSMGSLKFRHDWATSLSLFTFMHWRRKWQPTTIFLLGESQGWSNLVGCRLWGCTESDTMEVTQQQGYLFRKFQTRSAYIVAVFFSYLIFMYFNAVRKLTENFHFYQYLVLSNTPYRIREWMSYKLWS